MKRFILFLMILVLLPVCGIAEEETEAETGESLPFAVRHGDRSVPRVAITMDDCGNIDTVEKALNFCEEEHVYITFFPIGINIRKKHAEIWRRIAESPWAEIGSHTMKHGCWEQQKASTTRSQIAAFNERLDAVLGYHYQVRVIRPPHGHYSRENYSLQKKLKTILADYGFEHVVLWDVSQTEAYKAIQNVRNGSILLYHAYIKDLNGIKKLVPMLRKRGFETATVSMLLGLDTQEAQETPEDDVLPGIEEAPASNSTPTP